ncbi:helix-turn-helix domain-containing protein, partial [Rickettsia argasii]
LFLKKQLYILNMSIYDLEKNCGIGDSTIMHFIKENSTKKSLSTPVIIALAQYFNMSIDYMIGRSQPI